MTWPVPAAPQPAAAATPQPCFGGTCPTTGRRRKRTGAVAVNHCAQNEHDRSTVRAFYPLRICVGGLHVILRASRRAGVHSQNRGRSLDSYCRRQIRPGSRIEPPVLRFQTKDRDRIRQPKNSESRSRSAIAIEHSARIGESHGSSTCEPVTSMLALEPCVAPVRAFAALLGDRLDAARHHRSPWSRSRCARSSTGLACIAGVHPDRVARARLDAQAAHDAAQLVDLEDRRALLDRRCCRSPPG